MPFWQENNSFSGRSCFKVNPSTSCESGRYQDRRVAPSSSKVAEAVARESDDDGTTQRRVITRVKKYAVVFCVFAGFPFLVFVCSPYVSPVQVDNGTVQYRTVQYTMYRLCNNVVFSRVRACAYRTVQYRTNPFLQHTRRYCTVRYVHTVRQQQTYGTSGTAGNATQTPRSSSIDVRRVTTQSLSTLPKQQEL